VGGIDVVEGVNPGVAERAGDRGRAERAAADPDHEDVLGPLEGSDCLGDRVGVGCSGKVQRGVAEFARLAAARDPVVAGRDAVVEPVEGVARDSRGGLGGERVADVDLHTKGGSRRGNTVVDRGA